MFAQLRRGIDGALPDDGRQLLSTARVSGIAIPPALWMATGLVERLLLWLALSGARSSWNARPGHLCQPRAQYFEHPRPFKERRRWHVAEKVTAAERPSFSSNPRMRGSSRGTYEGGVMFDASGPPHSPRSAA